MSPILYGYARVSTEQQSLNMQIDAFKKLGIKEPNIYREKMSGAANSTSRPQLSSLLSILKPGDTLVVYKLDRLGRSLPNLIEIVNMLNAKGVQFKSICESMDTNTSYGKLIFNLFGTLAEFERDIIRDRTKAGLEAAKLRGKIGGKPRKLESVDEDMLFYKYLKGKYSITALSKEYKVSRQTIYNVIDRRKNKR